MRPLRHIHSHSAHEFPFDTLSRNAQLSIAVLSTAFSFIDKFQRRSIKLFRVRRNSRWVWVWVSQFAISDQPGETYGELQSMNKQPNEVETTERKKKKKYLWFFCMIHRPRCVAATMTRRILHIRTMFGSIDRFVPSIYYYHFHYLSLFIWRWFLFHFFVYSTRVTSNYFGSQFSFRSLFFLFCHRLPRISHFVRQTKKIIHT